MYVDHAQSHFKSLSSNDSVFEQFKNMLSAEFDQSLTYHLMEKLRNYIQHRALLLDGVAYTSRWVQTADDTKVLENSFKFYVNPQCLNEDPKMRKILSELNESDDQLDLRPRIREYVSQLASVHERMRSLIDPIFTRAAQTLLESMDLYSKMLGKDQTAAYLVQCDTSNKIVEHHFLNMQVIERRKLILQKYSHLLSMKKHVVSSIPNLGQSFHS